MKIGRPALFAVTLGLLTAVEATAQYTPQVMMPSSIRQTSYDYDYYAEQQGGASASPADAKPAAPAPAAPVAPAAPAAAASPGSTGEVAVSSVCEESPCRWCRDGALGDPWTLPQPGALKDRNITIGGWLSGGIYGNQWNSPSNGPIGMRNVGDGFTVDQMWIFAERKTNTEQQDWDFGGRVDYLFGADGPDTQAFGDKTWDYGWNSARDYGSAIPQMYGEVAYRDLSVKMGRFYTPAGYEVVQATGNFFYSHSYSHTFGEAFTHTGALATYKRNDNVTFYGGWVNGWDEGWQTADNGSMFLGGIGLTFSEKASLTWITTAGRFGTGEILSDGTVGANGDAYMNTFVFNYKLTDKLTYVFQHDLGTNYNNGGDDNQWYGIGNYLIRKVNDCLSYGARLEWFQDPQGARVANGCQGDYYEATVGFNYKPHANVTIRPELRYDWFNSFAGNNTMPFNDGTRSTQLSFGTDFIFTY